MFLKLWDMSYKRLGNYIQQVNVRNRDLETEVLLGVSITKKLIPSIANVIGTDMSVYKIIEKRQFAYGTVTSRNGEKISIALSDQYDKALISQIYVVFEVIDTEELLPEYLMMWFSRPEFDRYVRFHSHGSTRETFDWADMCEVELPIPSIEEQRQIVAQYQSIANKIKVNEQICEKLEATVQALYKHWFVDFEFPNEEGKPYKSSGGKMVWNEELGKEIPEGWVMKNLKTFGNVITGKTPSSSNPEDFGNEFQFVTPSDFVGNKVITDSSRKLSRIGRDRLLNKINPKKSVLVTCIGSDMGKVSLNIEECITNQQINSIISSKEYYSEFLYYKLNELKEELKSVAVGGSTMPMLSKSQFETIEILKPCDEIMEGFSNITYNITDYYSIQKKQNRKLTQLQSLLLSRLSVG